MTGGLRGRAMKPVARQFLNSDLAVNLTQVWAEKEASLTEAARGLPGDHDLPENAADDRAQAIREAAQAILAGDLQEHYLAHYTPVENAERATRYLGLDDDEWQGVRDGWVSRFRAEGIEADDAEIIQAHIKRQFNVPTGTFEDLVVGWDDAQTERAMREMLLGPLDDVEAAIEAATETLQESDS